MQMVLVGKWDKLPSIWLIVNWSSKFGEYIIQTFKISRLNIKNVSKSHIFFNSTGNPNGLLSPTILNDKKCLYWRKYNKVMPTVRKVKQNLICFLSSLFEMHSLGTKKIVLVGFGIPFCPIKITKCLIGKSLVV